MVACSRWGVAMVLAVGCCKHPTESPRTEHQLPVKDVYSSPDCQPACGGDDDDDEETHATHTCRPAETLTFHPAGGIKKRAHSVIKNSDNKVKRNDWTPASGKIQAWISACTVSTRGNTESQSRAGKVSLLSRCQLVIFLYSWRLLPASLQPLRRLFLLSNSTDRRSELERPNPSSHRVQEDWKVTLLLSSLQIWGTVPFLQM